MISVLLKDILGLETMLRLQSTTLPFFTVRKLPALKV